MDKYAMIISQICEQTTPGKKMLQKLMYLMERKGVVLNLNYSIHFYGPYSSKLDDALQALSARDVIKIETKERTHWISVLNIDEVNYSIETGEQEKIQFVLDHFLQEQAKDLEAITTLDFVAREILKNEGNDAQIIEAVKNIKGKKFSDNELKRELELLRKYEFLS